MAAKLGDVPPSTVNSWRVKGSIPGWRHQSILDAAKRHGISLEPSELNSIQPDDPESAAA